MYLYNIVVFIVFPIFIVLGSFLMSKRAFLIFNISMFFLFSLYYVFVLYMAYTKAFEINAGDYDSLYIIARALFYDLLYHFIGVFAFFVINTLVIYLKFWKSPPSSSM